MVHWLVCGAELLVRSVIDLERFLKGNALWGEARHCCSPCLVTYISCFLSVCFWEELAGKRDEP